MGIIGVLDNAGLLVCAPHTAHVVGKRIVIHVERLGNVVGRAHNREVIDVGPHGFAARLVLGEEARHLARDVVGVGRRGRGLDLLHERARPAPARDEPLRLELAKRLVDGDLAHVVLLAQLAYRGKLRIGGIRPVFYCLTQVIDDDLILEHVLAPLGNRHVNCKPSACL
jgi:hypothetical protein